MGNLRSKYTDEEWENLDRYIVKQNYTVSDMIQFGDYMRSAERTTPTYKTRDVFTEWSELKMKQK